MSPATLPTRRIGNVDVTAIGYGHMTYSEKLPDEERFKFLDALYESGCTNWDTANVYGDSEEFIGKWFARTGKRNEIFLATKFGLFPEPGKAVNGEPAYVHESIERSLKRLCTDYVDLYYLHRADPNVPIELTVRAMAELVKQGKVKQLGLSEVSAETLRRAHAVHPIAAVQCEYSPFTLDLEIEQAGLDLRETARELGVAIVAYSRSAAVSLRADTSLDDFPPDDMRRRLPRFSNENFQNIMKLCDLLSALGQKYDATPGQIALAWLLARGDDIIPIPSTTKIANLQENLGALAITLSPDDVEQILQAAKTANASWKGDQMPPALLSFIYGNTPPLQE